MDDIHLIIQKNNIGIYVYVNYKNKTNRILINILTENKCRGYIGLLWTRLYSIIYIYSSSLKN